MNFSQVAYKLASTVNEVAPANRKWTTVIQALLSDGVPASFNILKSVVDGYFLIIKW